MSVKYLRLKKWDNYMSCGFCNMEKILSFGLSLSLQLHTNWNRARSEVELEIMKNN